MSCHLAFPIGDESKRRVELSHSPSFNGKGRHMAEGLHFTRVKYVSQIHWPRYPYVQLTSHKDHRSSLEYPSSLTCSPDLTQLCRIKPVVDQPSQTREHGMPVAASTDTMPSASADESRPSSLDERPLGPVAAALMELQMRRFLPEDSVYEGTSDDELDGFQEHWGSSRWHRDSDSPPETDYSMCIAEECGYCGEWAS